MKFEQPQNEAELLDQTRWLLDLLQNIGVLVYTRVHVMPIMRGRVRGRVILSPNDDMRGFSDIEIVAKSRVAYLELKSATGKLSKDQIIFAENRVRHGAIFKKCETLEHVIETLEKLGVDVRKILNFKDM